MKIITVFLLLVLSGCENRTGKSTDALLLFRCTDDQLTLVDKEFNICTKSGYLDSYCFSQAKQTHCDPIETKKANRDG